MFVSQKTSKTFTTSWSVRKRKTFKTSKTKGTVKPVLTATSEQWSPVYNG
jgi:hypothetical protein